jgi:hypothetical protein
MPHFTAEDHGKDREENEAKVKDDEYEHTIIDADDKVKGRDYQSMIKVAPQQVKGQVTVEGYQLNVEDGVESENRVNDYDYVTVPSGCRDNAISRVQGEGQLKPCGAGYMAMDRSRSADTAGNKTEDSDYLALISTAQQKDLLSKQP